MKKFLLFFLIVFVVQNFYAQNTEIAKPSHGLQVYGLLGFGTFGALQLGGGIGYSAAWENPTKTDIPLEHKLTTDSQLIFTMFNTGLQWNTFLTYGLELTLPKELYLTVDFLGAGLGMNVPEFNDIGISFVTSLPGLQLSWKQLYFGWRNQYITSFYTSGSEFKTYLSVGVDLTKYLPTKNTRYHRNLKAND